MREGLGIWRRDVLFRNVGSRLEDVLRLQLALPTYFGRHYHCGVMRQSPPMFNQQTPLARL